MSEDTSPSRQAYPIVGTEGYKGRFASNISNIRLFKDNPYILDLTEGQRAILNADLLTPYNGELFYDDNKFIYVCSVVTNETTGEKEYLYKSQEKELYGKLKYYESKGVMNQLMSAYNNGQVYKFYYNTGSLLLYPNPSIVFPADYVSYSIRRQGLNSNNEPIYVAGSVVDGVIESKNIAMKLVNDTVTGNSYRRMGTAQIFNVNNITAGYSTIENGKFYVVDFYNSMSEIVDTRLFQAVESAAYDTQVPSASVVDLKIMIFRNGADLKSASNVYQIYAGEDLTKTVSYAVIAVYDDGTEKIITDKLDTAQLSREGWDVNTNGATEGTKFEVKFTYYPQIDETGSPIGSAIERSVFFQVTTYQYSKIYKCIPVVWSDYNTDLTINDTNAKTYKLKVYTLSADGVVENRTRSFYNSMQILNNEGDSVPVNASSFDGIYAFDPYNQCISFTFTSAAIAKEETFDFTMYNNGKLEHYRFNIDFGKSGNIDNTVKTAVDYTFVKAFNDNISEFGYGNGGIFEKLSEIYNMNSYPVYNKARIYKNASQQYEIELSMVESDSFVRDVYSRVINGTTYKPNRVVLYAVKDQTMTPLCSSSAINTTAKKVSVGTYSDINVTNIIRNLDQYDYILAQFRTATDNDDFIVNLGMFSIIKEV
jgi:hypothetical protein